MILSRVPRLAGTVGALLVLAGCASSGGAAPGAASAACAPSDAASLSQKFDSLHALAVQGRVTGALALAPHETKPQLANARDVGRLLQTKYPPALRDAGLGGTLEVTMVIDEAGSVRNVRMVRSSGFPELDSATLDVARTMRFRPARQGRCPVPFFFSRIPVTWMTQRS